METDTIAAIATPMGEGAIGIVRVSGPDAIPIVNKLFRGKDLSRVASHTIHYGHLVDPATGETVEEVLVAVMRAPRTYTREDVVEINCHGGIVTTSRVLQLVLDHGARLAEPGEFTKRAFLNGRIDLAQAEAVIDLIRAKTDRAMAVALQQMEGRLSNLIRRLRRRIVELLAHIEVTIDYPEHDVEEVTRSLLLERCREIGAEIDRLLETARQGKILREGVATAIVGRPNVGKSSLLNALAHEARAIVTDIPGTTRDLIEEQVNVRGIPLRLIDTAGIRDTEDLVERIGVQRAQEVLQTADLVLLVLNHSEPLTATDRQLIDMTRTLNTIVVVNKADLPRRIELDEVRAAFADRPVVLTSMRTEEGLDELEDAIARQFYTGNVPAGDLTYVSNVRHIRLLREARAALNEAIAGVEAGVPVDTVAIDLKRCFDRLGEIIGETASEELIDQIFRQFCLGK
ncbi:tRNA uridine-5-carboxymethylaminomethyl(34) synthesis GTPase MnmE [Calditerricola satsumensis]|uniref:tRNA modification GTPase MnmE n=1 Tax=Calditerricola satsumensis TaxID=373054 RepID=A0A8J3B8P9_9BACI|nr:tRNA uridine-5-carboxymethylaminomethyl(34) synthesis GTPase MnmE [Calditerricola satsumensis]GGJ97299.1 tRNA modification GTPase MnmE [Calditerricola satsumensis]